MAKLTIKEVPVRKLTPDPKNVRAHSKRNLEAIKASLDAFGQQRPLVVDAKLNIVAGNGTYLAALELGWKKLLVTVSSLKKRDLRAYAVADNRTAELAGWNRELLGKVVKELGNTEKALAAMGFKKGELEKIMKKGDVRKVSFNAKEKEEGPQSVRCPHCGQEFELEEDE